MSRRRVLAKGPTRAALALCFAVAGVSWAFVAAPAFAEDNEAAEAPAADPGPPPEAPAAAEGDAPEAPGLEPSASPTSNRPRSRVIRPDRSDLDDRLWDSSPDSQHALATPGARRVMECVAGCPKGPSMILAHGGNAAPVGGTPTPAEVAAEPAVPANEGIVCVAGC